MGKTSLLLVITALLCLPKVSAQALKVIRTDAFVKHTFSKVQKTLDDRFNYPEVSVDYFKSTNRKIVKLFNRIQERVHDIEQKPMSDLAVLNSLPVAVKTELQSLENLIVYIECFYSILSMFFDYIELEKSDTEKFPLLQTLERLETHIGLSGKLYAFVKPQSPFLSTGRISKNKEGIFESTDKIIRESSEMCNLQSPKQIIYHLYHAIALANLKNYVIIQFYYIGLKFSFIGNYTRKAQLASDEYEGRSEEILQLAKISMQQASGEIWRCDPTNYVYGETYVKVDKFMQGLLVEKSELNRKHFDMCTEYQLVNASEFHIRCGDKLLNCESLSADKHMSICKADISTGKRYEYIEYKSGKVLGRMKQCKTILENWSNSLCMCFCDELRLGSVKYFNLRKVFSDFNNNYVITGLKFVVHRLIIHLQIQQGKLLPDGQINTTTVHWKPVEDYGTSTKKIYPSQDYAIIDWRSHAIDLDDIIVQESHLVTGVRFKKLGSHLNLDVYASPFNYSTGQLINPETMSFFKYNSEIISRMELNLTNLDVPIFSNQPSVPISGTNQYLNFEHTSVDLDVAQNTVPFIDIQPVESMLPTPLSGVGIFYKGREKYGGFLAPKIFTYDFSEHLVSVDVFNEDNLL